MQGTHVFENIYDCPDVGQKKEFVFSHDISKSLIRNIHSVFPTLWAVVPSILATKVEHCKVAFATGLLAIINPCNCPHWRRVYLIVTIVW